MRRIFLKGLACLGAASALPLRAVAADFPAKPIKIVVPYAPGGASDTLARAIAETMTQTLGQAAIVENRTGASGTTGSEWVSRAPPDGHTLVMGTSASHSLNTVVFPKTYDPLTAFAPVALVTRVPNLIFAAPSLPVRSMQELVAYLKAKPHTPIAVGGPATSGRFAAELLMARLGLSLTVVPYLSSAPALLDVRGNQVPLGVTDLLGPTAMARSGDVAAIAVTGLRRAPALPNVPTVDETVAAGFEAVAWNGLFAPAGTPRSIIDVLNAAVRKTFEAEAVRKRFEEAGQEIAVSSPEGLASFQRQDIARWKGVAASNKLMF